MERRSERSLGPAREEPWLPQDDLRLYEAADGVTVLYDPDGLPDNDRYLRTDVVVNLDECE